VIKRLKSRVIPEVEKNSGVTREKTKWPLPGVLSTTGMPKIATFSDKNCHLNQICEAL